MSSLYAISTMFSSSNETRKMVQNNLLTLEDQNFKIISVFTNLGSGFLAGKCPLLTCRQSFEEYGFSLFLKIDL